MRYTSYAAMVIGSKTLMMKVYEIFPESGDAGEDQEKQQKNSDAPNRAKEPKHTGGQVDAEQDSVGQVDAEQDSVGQRRGIREIDCIRHDYALGRIAHDEGIVPFSLIEEISEVLKFFQQRMREYGIEKYRCYSTSAIRHASNQLSVLYQIKIRTGIQVDILGNSEHRFLMYKGMQMSDLDFDDIIRENTAILDIGSGSVQVSLFVKQALCVTQKLDIGAARSMEILKSVDNNPLGYISVMEEYIQHEIDMFQTGYLKGKDIKNVLAVGDEIRNLIKSAPELPVVSSLDYEQICTIYKKIKKASYQDLAMRYDLSVEDARMLLPSAIVYKKFLEQSNARTLYIFETNLCDGMVVDYALDTKQIRIQHDFTKDIIASVKYMGKRYRYDKAHADYVSKVACEIFDKTVKYHGLFKRDRLILRISAILHDIGKYVNLTEPSRNGYQLIISTEIMGISNKERREAANVVLYNEESLPLSANVDEEFPREDYLKIAQLTAILRLANALDGGNRQRYQRPDITRKKKELLITVESLHDMTLELSLFEEKADFFSEILGVKPILKQKTIL